MDDDEGVAVTLSLHQWLLVREALDEYESVVSHRPGGRFGRPNERQKQAENHAQILGELTELAASLGAQIGVGPP